MSKARHAVAVVLIALVTFSLAQATTRQIVVHVDQAELAWSDGRVQQRILTELTRNKALTAVGTDQFGEQLPPLPANEYDPEAWLDWAAEIGGRYLMVVDVQREGLERRKTFSLPIIFHRYETVAFVEGELKVFDIQKRRMLTSEPFAEKISGAKQFQGSTDDNRNDPSLHIPASEKIRLFQTLEDALARKLSERVSALTRGR